MPKADFLKLRIFTVVSLLFVTPAGFYLKFYSGPYHFWVNNSVAGVFYEIFWCLLVLLIIPGAKTWKIVLPVFIATCLLEFVQLCHNNLLDYLRGFFIGRTILGNSFNPSDFIYYVIGSIAAYIWIILLRRKAAATES
jgi:hypothetical protein